MEACGQSTSSPAGMPRTLVAVLRNRALRQPGRVAFTFLPNGEADGPSLTHAELDRRARAIAVWLSSVARPRDRAILLYQSCQDFVEGFFGCVYAGLAAVPAYPLDTARLARTVARLETIVDD